MAFYPDELSPIDRIRNLGKSTDLPDINVIKNRRQWKSLVLGKKDTGMNNFATITEEKEEEISSDGSQGANSNKGGSCLSINSGVVTNKKITFPKPRKYITSRVSDRKEDVGLKTIDGPVKSSPIPGNVHKESLSADKKKGNLDDLPSVSTSTKSNAPEVKHILKAKKSQEFVAPKQEFIENFALNEVPIETQWNEAVSDAGFLTGWPKNSSEKLGFMKYESVQIPKSKNEDKKKSIGNGKPIETKSESKQSKKKGSKSKKGGKLPKGEEESPSTSKSGNPNSNEGKQKAEKGKSLNMKDVVNVYKNLAYGSKEEIKSFVEKLSFVKDEAENDKNLLSVMNLKALENKIKNITKKTSKNPEASTSQEKKTKGGKPVRKNRKAHIERLARHKVVKVPAVLNYNYLRNSIGSTAAEKVSEEKGKRSLMKDKEPWKYVGMQSILDKTYFVYPAYPPSTNLKKVGKKSKGGAKGAQNKTDDSRYKDKKGEAEVVATNSSVPPKIGPKVKAQPVISQNLLTKVNPKETIRSGMTRSMNALKVFGSASNKSMSRPSATTVCTVQFRPMFAPKTHTSSPVKESDSTDPSLLVYLHGTKAINVKSPYSDKQFSRVKFFRKDGKEMPLIKGLNRKVLSKSYKNVSVRNISFPEKLCRVRSLDLLDFDEDIQNITDFLRSQNSPGLKDQEELNISERCPAKESESRQQRRHPPPYQNHHHHHQHGTPRASLSPDSIINEISKNIEHLQYLPDTEENRKMIADFFDELDHRIEASKNAQLDVPNYPPLSNSYRPIPILGY